MMMHDGQPYKSPTSYLSAWMGQPRTARGDLEERILELEELGLADDNELLRRTEQRSMSLQLSRCCIRNHLILLLLMRTYCCCERFLKYAMV